MRGEYTMSGSLVVEFGLLWAKPNTKLEGLIHTNLPEFLPFNERLHPWRKSGVTFRVYQIRIKVKEPTRWQRD